MSFVVCLLLWINSRKISRITRRRFVSDDEIVNDVNDVHKDTRLFINPDLAGMNAPGTAHILGEIGVILIWSFVPDCKCLLLSGFTEQPRLELGCHNRMIAEVVSFSITDIDVINIGNGHSSITYDLNCVKENEL